MNRTAALALLCLLPLTACSSGGDAPQAAPSPSPPAAASALPSVAPGATLVLRPDGLALDGTRIPFGSGTSVVVPALTAALGEPAQQSVPCSQGTRTAVGVEGFDVLFDGDRFVGWDDSTGGLQTEQGLKVGSTRADVVRLVPDAEFSTGEGGPQFTSPSGLGGFLENDSEDAVVVGLTGGETCLAG